MKEILSKMTIEDKIALCSGADFWHTKVMERHGIPSVMMADGPHGLRKQVNETDMLGINESLPATSFPTAVSTGCSWDESLVRDIGKAIAEEAIAGGVGIVLGPGANIKRNPLCGRNFEYYSEDPHLTGKLAASFIKGVESTGVAASLKHFAFNNQEYKRFASDSVMDERTMREIYLAGFETAVKEGKPSTVMSSYNKINGEYTSGSKMLLTDILRGEWGFGGMVVTDWGGMSDRIKGFKAGCDLVMPGGSAYMEPEALRAVADGELDEKDIDACAERVLRMVFKAAALQKNRTPADMAAHHELARRAAEESAVLLKNDDAALPFASENGIVFIGHMAKEIRYQGTGSSHMNPWTLINATDACPDIPFVAGCDANGDTNEALIAEAVSAAKQSRTAVVCAGLTAAYESEGFDRDNMKMPEGHVRLIEAVADANPNTVVVLMSGSAVELPWADKVKSILYMGLPGQAGGEAIANLLFGRAVPCGKLAESWPMKYTDCVCSDYYAGGRKDAHYREGVYVGYRYFATAGVGVRYPFGHGLSYAAFTYANMRIVGETVTVEVTNTGAMPAAEVVQLYIAPPKGEIYRPAKVLKAFTKTLLQPGETKTVTLTLNERCFAVWNGGWKTPAGMYTVLVGGSSEYLPVSATVDKAGQPVSQPAPSWYFEPKGHPSHNDWERLLERNVQEATLIKGAFTMENSVMEMKELSFIMKLLYKIVENTVSKGIEGKKDYSNPVFRMLMNSAADASLSGMRINSGMKNYVLEGVLAMANGHFIKGIHLVFKKVKSL